MFLTCRFLRDVASVNSFEYATQVEFHQGDAQNIYFQLVDGSVDTVDKGYMPAGRRYMPNALATVQVTFKNVDDAKQFTRAATKPFPEDTSIWLVQVLPTDPLRGTVSLKIVLGEPSRTLNALIQPALHIHPTG